MNASLPLSGLSVLDLTRNVAGPYATLILAELGADVVKVESPGSGDDTRAWGPPFVDGFSPMFLALNRNKRSLVLDLHETASSSVIGRLVDRADVLIENFRPGALDRLGFGYAWAAERNPRLVYTSITAYGDNGPLRDLPGYDPLMQAYAGLMSVTGEPGRPPVRVGVSIVDVATGMWAAIATLAALNERPATSHGRHIVVSLYETTLAWMASHLAAYWAGGAPGRIGSGTNGIVPYQAFATADGYLVIAAGNDNLFKRLAAALGHPKWSSDPRYRTNPARVANRDGIVARIEAVTRRHQTAELAATLQMAGVPCSTVRDVAQVANDPQAAALGIFQHVGGLLPGFRSVGLPFLIDGIRPPLRQPPPTVGQHTPEILAELGFDRQELMEGPE